MSSSRDIKQRLVEYIENHISMLGIKGVYLSHGFNVTPRSEFTYAATHEGHNYHIILHRYPTEQKCIGSVLELGGAGIDLHLTYNTSTKLLTMPAKNGPRTVLKQDDIGSIFGDIRFILEGLPKCKTPQLDVA